MTTRKNLLDRVEIASPCNANWDQMEGSSQIRYCSECHKYVYNLSEMTRGEAEALVVSRRNQMCARLTRDLDGNTINVDSLPPVRLMSWRPGAVARTVLSALISIAPAGAALSQGHHAPSHSGHSLDESGRKVHRPVPGTATSAISGIVSDENGAAKAGVVVTLTSEASGEALSQLTSGEGEFRFDGLPARTYIVEVQAQGYRAVRHHDISLQQGEARRIDVAMEKLLEMMGGALSIPAQPLRTLYLESDRVVVGQIGKSTAESKGSGHLVKTILSVSQTIKGDGHKPSVVVYHWPYAKKGKFSEGETVIVFLQRREGVSVGNEGDTYELIYGSASAKHLSDLELETYLQRLEDLKAILNNPDSKPTDTVEWLVRCAEDPVTRREGAFELHSSALREDWDKELANRNAAGVPVGSTFKKSRDEEPSFSALLTSDQKQRLINALLKSDELVDGDFELIGLVNRWNNPSLLPFLMTHLRRHVETTPESTRRLMGSVAALLGDDKVNALLRNYYDNASYEDLEAEQNMDSDEDEAADQDEVADEAEDESDATDRNEEAAHKLSPEAARQARAAMLKAFLEAAEAKIKAASPQQ